MKNNQTLLKKIEQELKNRSQNLELEKKMSIAFQSKLNQQISNKLNSLKKEKQEHSALIWKIFTYYPRLFQNSMKKKSLIGLTVGLALIIIAVWLHLKPQQSKVAPSQTSDLDSLLAGADKNWNNVETSIKNLDSIDESLDNEQKLSLLIDSLITKAESSLNNTAPPEQTIPTPSLGEDTSSATINTTDLDVLLNEVDTAASAANNSISDFDSIDQEQDKISI